MLISKLIYADLKRYLSITGHCAPSALSYLCYLLSPRYLPVLIYRLSSMFYRNNLRYLAWIFGRFNQLLHGIEIAPACHIGPGLFLPHTFGTVIGASFIGTNATIFQGCTLGAKYLVFDYSSDSRPKIGCGVTLGAGCKVLGDVYIGDNVIIGANAVVISDLPSNVTAVGVPAKAI